LKQSWAAIVDDTGIYAEVNYPVHDLAISEAEGLGTNWEV
jgi:hypothetical protein